MSITARFTEMAQVRDGLRSLEADPSRIVMERFLSPTEAVIAGRPTILVGTNNYLGLTFDPEIIEAGCAAMRASATRHFMPSAECATGAEQVLLRGRLRLKQAQQPEP